MLLMFQLNENNFSQLHDKCFFKYLYINFMPVTNRMIFRLNDKIKVLLKQFFITHIIKVICMCNIKVAGFIFW